MKGSTSVAIDLGGTRIKIGIVRDGTILDRTTIDAHSDRPLAAGLDRLRGAVEELLSRNAVSAASLRGVGVAFAGQVDPVAKRILSTNGKHLDGPSVDLAGWVEANWGVPFEMDNDARLAGLGEWKHGAGVGSDDLVVVTFGTGIGTAAVVRGRLLRGKHYQAGSLGGHFIVDPRGAVCTCGNRGCVEAQASGWALERMLADPDVHSEVQQAAGGTGPIHYRDLFRAAGEAGEAASQIAARSIEVWSALIVTLIHAYDPERVVIGGGIVEENPELIELLRKVADERAWIPGGPVEVVGAMHPDGAALLGIDYLLNHGGMSVFL